MLTSDLELIGFVEKLPEGTAPTRGEPIVRQSMIVRHAFDCEECGIHVSDTSHLIQWRGWLGRRCRTDVLESELHRVRSHGGVLPAGVAAALSALERRGKKKSR